MERKRKWDLQGAEPERAADKEKRELEGAKTTTIAASEERNSKDPAALAREAAMRISAQLAKDETKDRRSMQREEEAEEEREKEKEEKQKEEKARRRKTKTASDSEHDGELGEGMINFSGRVTEVNASTAAETSLAHTIGLVLEEGDAEKEKEKVHHYYTGAGPSQKLEETAALKDTIDINDCRHRYHLTKSLTIKQIEETTGALLLVRGKYYPDRKLATSEREPPLLIEVAAHTETALKEAIRKIREIMQTGPPVASGHRERTESSPSASFSASKVFAPFEMPSYGGGVRQKILGPQGSYLKHIQGVTGTRVFLRGRGSGHVELGQREEHLEPLHLLIVPDKGAASRDAVNVTEAVRLCEDLLATVKADLLDSQQRSPTMSSSYYAMNGLSYGAPSGTTYDIPQGIHNAPVPNSAIPYPTVLAPPSLPYPASASSLASYAQLPSYLSQAAPSAPSPTNYATGIPVQSSYPLPPHFPPPPPPPPSSSR